jgi:hypothetical protein
MRDPLHDGVEVSQVLLMPGRAAAGRRIGEIQRQRAADKVEAAGTRRPRERLRFVGALHLSPINACGGRRDVTI